jgi:oligopeptide transport system substrate-binding protein
MRAVSLRWLVVLTGLTLACSRPPAATGSPEAVLRYAQVGSVTTLDPARAGWTVESRVIEQMAEGLTDVDASLQIRAALADSWEITDGGRTFRFRLRKGATLAEGRPLTSADIAAALTRLAAPGDLVGWAVIADVVGAEEYKSGRAREVSGLETPDSSTLVVHLVSPSGRFLYQLATASAVVFAGTGSAEDWARGRVPGSGPFHLESIQDQGDTDLRRQRLVFRARSGALRKPRIQGMVWDLYATAADLARGLGKESYDVVTSADPEPTLTRALPRHRSLQAMSLGFLGLYFDCEKPPVDRPEARRAIALAADRGPLEASGLVEGFHLPGALGPLPADVRLRRDPEAAVALARRAGLDPRKPVPLSVAYSKSFEYGDLSEWIRGPLARSLEPIGLRVEAAEQPDDGALDRRYGERRDHAFLFGSFPDTMDPCLVLEPFRSQSSAFNWSRYSRAEVDEDYRTCARSREATSQQRAIAHALRLVADDAPVLPLTRIRQRAYVAPRVAGFVPSPLEGVDFCPVTLRGEP